MNLFERFEAVAASQPDRLALQIKEATGYRRLTYGDVARQARLAAAALVRAGLAPGERVALMSENRPEWAVAYFAVAAAGGTVVPLDVQLGDAEVANRPAACRVSDGRRLRQAGPAPPRRAAERRTARLGSGPGRRRGRRADARIPRRPEASGPGASTASPGRERRPGLDPLHVGDHRHPQGRHAEPRELPGERRERHEVPVWSTPRTTCCRLLPLHHAFPFTVQLILLYTGARITFPPSLKGPDLLGLHARDGRDAPGGRPAALLPAPQGHLRPDRRSGRSPCGRC